MDITKFEVKTLSIIIMMSIMQLGFGQYFVPIYVTSTKPPEVVNPIFIKTTSEVDFTYRRVDTAFREAYEGYNYLFVGTDIFPIHFESYDDFNIAVFNQDNDVEILYTGAQGALKNNFIYDRNKAFNEFARVDSLESLTPDDVSIKLDSLTKEWTSKLNANNFSDLFIKDEMMFYKSYTNYFKLYHKQFKGGNSIEDTSLANMPSMDYNDDRYYTTIPYFAELAKLYHFKKIESFGSVGQSRSYINDLQGYQMAADVKGKAFIQSTEHHPQAKDLYKISKPQYQAHSSQDRRFHRKSRKSGKGSEFSFPFARTVDGTIVDFKKMKEKKVYFMLYDITDPKLGQNLSLWNQFYKDKNEDDAVFIACAINGDRNLELWKSLQFRSQVVGYNVNGDSKTNADYLESMGIFLLPRVIEINADGNVANPNMDLNFNKRNVFEPSNARRQ